MPLYVYRCRHGHETEARRPIAERRMPVECETCGELADIIIVAANVPADGRYSYRHDK